MAAMSGDNKVGSRFNRALTNDEVAMVLDTLRASGPPAAFIKMWDIILLEAEGMTWEEAITRDLEFHVRDYAIPTAQQDRLRAAMLLRRRRAMRRKIHWSWFQFGPAFSD